MKRFTILSSLMLAAAPVLAGADGDPAVLYERGAYRRAAAVASQRSDATALTVLARVRALEGRYDEAIATAERAVKAAPGSTAAHYALSEAHGLRAREAGPLKALGSARAFKREAEAALAIDPSHVESLVAMIEFHRMAPGIAGGDRKKRPALLERLVAADPVRGWGMRAQDALRSEDTTRAEQCWRKAVEADPASARAKAALAQWLAVSRRDVPLAEQLAAEATALEPWRIAPWQVLASVQAHGKRWEELEATLAKSEAAMDGRRDAWFAAGRQLVSDGAEPVRAERYLRHYLAAESEPAAPAPAVARWRLAQALEQQGRRSEAIAELQAALALDSRLEPARKDLQRLRR
ncbi:MAG: hypothetical protein HZA61_08765 [Candidatus Eisenbacteria bacterium]|uniref:Tetratricopeptide repeat protein n=1 Tax=Eiseniibacteriota bacterium TaxID=2212470 RepID=A0A933SE23_UNCEI|nr:hypothetical protein [Candidatus Eisenbacteria bacterium]